MQAIQLMDYGHEPTFIESELSAQFRICTARLDRQGDIIEPSGVDWSDYRNNPVVKFEHGFSGIALPIATSADKSGELQVSYGKPGDPEPEDAIYATAFFDSEDSLSRQMFHLVKCGFLRAASIHVAPRKYEMLFTGGVHAFTSSVLEWSLCTVGQNPDAFRKSFGKKEIWKDAFGLQLELANQILGEQTLGGEEIHPSLAKCLTAIQKVRPSVIRGATVDKKILTDEEVGKLDLPALAKALADVSGYEVETVKRLRSRAKSLQDKQEPPIEPKQVDVKPGAAFLSAVHGELRLLKSKVEAAGKVTEDPDVLAFAGQTLAGSISESLLSIEAAYEKSFPDAPSLVVEESEAEFELVKSWLAENSKSQFVLEGLAARLERSLPNADALAKSVPAVVKHLRELSSKAKSYTPKGEDDSKRLEVLTQRVNQLAAKFEKVVEAIGKSPA